LGLDLRTDRATKLIVKYPAKWHIEDIPVQFLDIGFPKQAGVQTDGPGF
jgi:hypothetical protein